MLFFLILYVIQRLVICRKQHTTCDKVYMLKSYTVPLRYNTENNIIINDNFF